MVHKHLVGYTLLQKIARLSCLHRLHTFAACPLHQLRCPWHRPAGYSGQVWGWCARTSPLERHPANTNPLEYHRPCTITWDCHPACTWAANSVDMGTTPARHR